MNPKLLLNIEGNELINSLYRRAADALENGNYSLLTARDMFFLSDMREKEFPLNDPEMPLLYFRFYGDKSRLLSSTPPKPPENNDPFAWTEYCAALRRRTLESEALYGACPTDELTEYENVKTACLSRFFANETELASRHNELALALLAGVLPPHREARAAEMLISFVKEKRVFTDDSLLSEALFRCGYGDAAYKVLASGTNTRGGVRAICEHLLGINTENSSPAFEHILLRPSFVKAAGALHGELETLKGSIFVDIHFENNIAVFSFKTKRSVTLILPDGQMKSYPAGKNTVVYNNICRR